MLSEDKCKKCGKYFTNIEYKWCKPCQIKELKSFTSGNEKIDDLIQEMQLKIDCPQNIVFEWIPYDQFSDVKEIGKDDSATIYSAIWKDGPLKYDNSENEYTRNQQNKKVALKYLFNSQNITNEFPDEVRNFFVN